MADCANEFLEDLSDHFGGHPKTAGRTFTGGADFFLKEIFSLSASASQREDLGDGSNDRLVDQEAETVQADQHRAAFVADNAHREREVDAEGGD